MTVGGGHCPKPLAKVLRNVAKAAKKGQKRCPQRVATTISYNDDNKEADS
jgi:hypothetical protein